MKSTLLLPSYFRYMGYLLAIPGLVLGYFIQFEYFTFRCLQYGRSALFGGNENFTDEIATTAIVAGLLFIGFAKHKVENEITASHRSKALYYSILASLIFVILMMLLNLFSDFQSVQLSKFLSKSIILVFYFFLYHPILFTLLRWYFSFLKKKDDLKPMARFRHTFFYTFGLILFIAGAFGSISFSVFPIKDIDIAGSFYFLMLIGLAITFMSKEKTENIEIDEIRSTSLYIATYFTAFAFLTATWLIYNADYWYVLCLYPVLLIAGYIILFQYKKRILIKGGRALQIIDLS